MTIGWRATKVRFGSLADLLPHISLMSAFELPFQPIDATHALKRSAGVSKSDVFLGLSFSRHAILFR